MPYHEGFPNRFLILIVLLILGIADAQDARTVDRWADRIGEDLSDLADIVARPNDLIKKYIELNAHVEDKAGSDLIDVISESVGRMLRRKMDAVRCILKVAEEAAESYNDTDLIGLIKFDEEISENLSLSYYSGKWSPVNGYKLQEVPESIQNNSFLYKNMNLTTDSHFYNIPVNTSYSAVHVPTNIYDLAFEVNVAIQWSKALDDVFRKNYESDPALSWQYFGSSTGILRLFPAMQWRSEDRAGDPIPDLYDCRRQSWFIESATCSKDMVILLDITGSMRGAPYSIGKTTASEILGTLSNNDFVTIITYNNVTHEVVPCFGRMLVQATPENLQTFRDRLEKIDVLESANLTLAMEEAFDILEENRAVKNCTSMSPCIQTIMLITDGVPGNVSEVIMQRNFLENGTYIPVRIFTYLVGRDITNVAEIKWIACTNRGYYSHVHTLSEVREQVLKYIDVIARPLVLQKVRHPLIWTHAYADISNPALATWLWLVMDQPEKVLELLSGQKGGKAGVPKSGDPINTKKLGNQERKTTSNPLVKAEQKYRLLTSVSIPAYDRKKSSSNMTRYADLLGVAGTDVPLDEINKLTLPFKLGMNGYAFIVSNNGYVILHPDLRPGAQGKLKPNYNSIDLTEVEIIDDDSEPRKPPATILTLREKLVNHEHGTMKGIPVRIHYDDYRRVTLENRDYFYAPLPETPFGIAIALPDYGITWIKVGDEIARTQSMNERILDYFKGDRWRVHPHWVYCRYHYLEGHEFATVENETRHFLGALDEPGWYWAEQYEESEEERSHSNERDEDGERRKLYCGRASLDDDSYYCNKELVQLLVFDAKVTNSSFNEEFKYKTTEDEELGKAYSVFVRFVATQSGLTRWQYIGKHPLAKNKTSHGTDEKILEFGDVYRRAVNEPWYKGAIFQHRIDPDSISITVPSGAGMNAIVTVAKGIFPKDGSKEASAAVAGFQMPMLSFYNRFINITSSVTETSIGCNHDETDCYLLDQNGYVVVCDSHDDTGKFMGVIEGSVMGSLIEQGVYLPMDIYDYQAFCSVPEAEGDASILETPIKHMMQLLTWFFARLLWLTSQFLDVPETWARKHANKEEDSPDPSPPPHWTTRYYPCDQKRILYILSNFTDRKVITNITSHPSRPFYAQKIPRTNLVLVVVNALFASPYERYVVEPWELKPSSYSNESIQAPCHKLYLTAYPRRGLEGCYSDHPLEKEITECGSGSEKYLRVPRSAIFLIALMMFLNVLRCIDTQYSGYQ